MRKRGILGGLIILFIGIIVLLSNYGILNVTLFVGFYDLWPLIFVVIGINIIFKRNRIVMISTWAAFFLAVIIYSQFVVWKYNPDWLFNIVEKFFPHNPDGNYL